jgi:thiol:disulfide interchange protein DsbD
MKPLLWLWLAIASAWSPAFADNAEPELLEPDQAFALSVRATGPDKVEATWKIAPGYYLYRDKFKFEAADATLNLAEPRIPKGIKKDDPLFGEVETYRKAVSITLPLTADGSVRSAALRITSQGCADVGVCYPPQTKTVSVALPAIEVSPAAPAAAASNSKALESLAALGSWLDPRGSQPQFLEPDQAFTLDITPVDEKTVLADIRIADGYYLYRDKTRFEGGDLDGYRLPPGKVKDDAYFGKTEVYYDRLQVRLPLKAAPANGTVNLTARYQGCAEQGICYPPIAKTMKVALAGVPASTQPVNDAVSVPGLDNGSPTPARTTGAAFWGALLAAFGTGLLLTFTPCVLPMVPILSSVIVGSSDRRVTKLEGGLLSGAYVLGTAVTYTAAGVLAGLTGEQLQAYFQNAWAIGFLAVVFVALSLSMFGFFDLHLPGFLQTALHKHSADLHLKTKHTKVGAFIGVFGMGLIAALIVGACVSPLVISALGVAIANRDPVLGGAIMFAMALGMGVILIAVGVGAGYLIPKAGPWMNTIKHVFGVLLLAVAIYLLGALPQVPVLLLWGALLIVLGVYLGATQSLPKDARGLAYLWKGVGTVLLLWGVLALLGGMAGNRDISRPLTLPQLVGVAGPSGAGTTEAAAPLFTRVSTLAELEEGLAQARSAGRPAIVDYYADWCTDCVRMEKATFSDPQVRRALGRFVLLQADVTDTGAESRALKQRLGVLGPPAMVFFGPDGAERQALRFYGFKPADAFLAHLARL